MSNACIGIFNFVDTMGGISSIHSKWNEIKRLCDKDLHFKEFRLNLKSSLK